MDLSSINSTLNMLSGKIKDYLENTPRIDFATYEQQQDIRYISNKYNEIVQLYSNLLDLLTEIDYFTSLCKKAIKLLNGNTSLEQAQKGKIKAVVELIKTLSEPLFTEKERLKTIEMFYRNIYTRRDF